MINKIEQKVIKFIGGKDLLNENDKVLVGFSGGPDSVFLLCFLNKFQKKYGIKLGAVHINHRLRGEDAEKDEEFCRNFCTQLNIEYFSARKKVKSYALKKKISFEEAGREIRYSVFEDTASRNNYNKIATGHNSTDNAETVLLNIIKGTGIKGISGIPFRRGNIIRPILILSKKEILEYLDQKGINYRIDKTNLDINYERNFLRNEIIPALKKKLNPSLEDSIFHSSETFKETAKFIDKKIEHLINSVEIDKKGKLLKIFHNRLKTLDEEFLGDFLREAVKRNFSKQLSFNDIINLKSLLKTKTGRKIDLSENLSALKEREQILIFSDTIDKTFLPVKLHVDQSVKLNGKVFSIKKSRIEDVKIADDKNIEFISADYCGEDFLLREWKDGDRFFPLGLKLAGSGKHGSKKISDFLNEQKIPSFLKKKQLVLTSQNKIVWVLGIRLDDRFKLTENTKKIYKLCLK